MSFSIDSPSLYTIGPLKEIQLVPSSAWHHVRGHRKGDSRWLRSKGSLLASTFTCGYPKTNCFVLYDLSGNRCFGVVLEVNQKKNIKNKTHLACAPSISYPERPSLRNNSFIHFGFLDPFLVKQVEEVIKNCEIDLVSHVLTCRGIPCTNAFWTKQLKFKLDFFRCKFFLMFRRLLEIAFQNSLVAFSYHPTFFIQP